MQNAEIDENGIVVKEGWMCDEDCNGCVCFTGFAPCSHCTDHYRIVGENDEE